MLKNITQHPITTLGGALLGLLQSAVISAAMAYTQNPQTSDWKPYAVAGGVGAATAITGALMKDRTTVNAIAPLEPIAAVNPVVLKAADQVATQFLLEKLGYSDVNKSIKITTE